MTPRWPRTSRRARCLGCRTPAEIPAGCILSNEFFDALPVHRVLHDGHELREYYVNAINGRLAEETGPLSSTAIEEYFSEQAITLQPGQQAEANLAACDWIANAAHRLGRGVNPDNRLRSRRPRTL